MKYSIFTLAAAFAGALLFGAAAVQADEGHDHDHDDGHGHSQSHSGKDSHAHGGKKNHAHGGKENHAHGGKENHAHGGKENHAHGDGHGKKDHHAADTAAGAVVMNSHDGMTLLYKHLGEMETELAAGKLEGIHAHFDAIAASVKDLDKDTGLSADKKKRVQGYVKNVLKLSDKVHHAADGNKPDQAKRELAKLKAQVDVLDKQFAHSHKPGAETLQEAKGHSHGSK